jgi:hypothetical protein
MKDFLKGFGSLLKKNNTNLTTSGSQKIGDLVEDEAYIDGEDTTTDLIMETDSKIEEISQYLWRSNDDQVTKTSGQIDDTLNIPSIEELPEIEDMVQTENIIIEKLIDEILIDKDFLNNLCIQISHKLYEKINNSELNPLNFDIEGVDKNLFDFANKVIEDFQPILLKAFEKFSQENILEKHA